MVSSPKSQLLPEVPRVTGLEGDGRTPADEGKRGSGRGGPVRQGGGRSVAVGLRDVRRGRRTGDEEVDGHTRQGVTEGHQSFVNYLLTYRHISDHQLRTRYTGH